MTRFQKSPQLANKHGWGTEKLLTARIKRLASALAVSIAVLPPSIALAQTGNPNEICLPPQEPYVPSGDEEFKEYAGFISQDFERYFNELTSYFACMDATRQAVFDRARSVSQEHQAFWKRAKTLGVIEKAATPQEQMTGR